MEQLFGNNRQTPGIELKINNQKKQIVRSIYFNGSASNAELSAELELSTPKINSLIQELIGEGLITELGQGNSSGGRRPLIYGLTEDAFYVAGITINVNYSVISVYNACNAEISGPHYIPEKMEKDFSLFCEHKKTSEIRGTDSRTADIARSSLFKILENVPPQNFQTLDQ